MFSLMGQFRGPQRIPDSPSDLCILGGAVHGRILGWAEVAAATPFPLKFLYYFYRILSQKNKNYLE